MPVKLDSGVESKVAFCGCLVEGSWMGRLAEETLKSHDVMGREEKALTTAEETSSSTCRNFATELSLETLSSLRIFFRAATPCSFLSSLPFLVVTFLFL